MSSDIYIPLSVVLSHPAQFQFKAALNVEYETLVDGLDFASRRGINDLDWEYIVSGLKPVLLCKFGARDTWRCVDMVINEEVVTMADGFSHSDCIKRTRCLHVSCGGEFRGWLQHWLLENEFEHEVLE